MDSVDEIFAQKLGKLEVFIERYDPMEIFHISV